MSTSIYLAFLWHMHQPLYKDTRTVQYELPWVGLHALKGYTDMPALLERFPDIKATFNITGCLIEQIEDYASGRAQDTYFTLMKKDAETLTKAEKYFMLDTFFMNNWETIIKKHPRYSRLLQKRGDILPYASDAIINAFALDEYRDLQLLFPLSWCGYTVQRDYPDLARLWNQSSPFTEQDKQTFFAIHTSIMQHIVRRFRELAARDQIEITTSPYYHPILPLLYSESPQYGFSWKEDVNAHIKKACDMHKHHFGSYPHGMWPSEGSVSPSIVPCFAQNHIQWIASDEDVLFHSLDSPHDRSFIYKPYALDTPQGRVAIFFRDKKLSDLIGFHYAHMGTHDAVEHFISSIHSIRSSVEHIQGEHIIPIILDGENAWETYKGGGEEFLSLLYERLSREPFIKTTTFTHFLSHASPEHALTRLHAGSWIHANFAIWYDHFEDKQAWELVAHARSMLCHMPLPEDIASQAWTALYAAEGSDWFWWYGDEFSSHTNSIFDNLFRSHLMSVYQLAGATIPAELYIPIKKKGESSYYMRPQHMISPHLDILGTPEDTSWQGAGRYANEQHLSSMYGHPLYINHVLFGNNTTHLYMALSLTKEALSSISRLSIRLLRGHHQFEYIYSLEERGPIETCTHTHFIFSHRILAIQIDRAILIDRNQHDIYCFICAISRDGLSYRWPKTHNIHWQIVDKES